MTDTTQDDLLERARFVVQLFRECDAIQLPHGPTEQVLTGMINRIEELEAKLARAVEALRFYAWENEMRLPSDGPWGVGSNDFGKQARATLAELKGQDDE